MKRVTVIGGGIAGLGAAYEIAKASRSGSDVEFVLVEKDPRLGGKIFTDRAPDRDGGLYVADGGSDSFLTEKPAVHRAAAELGIADQLCGTLDENKRTFIVKDGRLVELPDGIMMFAPTKIVPLATTRLYSWPGKIRMALDLVIPRKERWAPGETARDHDETLESFVVRRMGRECLDRLAEPLVGGVNGSDPATMSLAATYPNLLEMEQKHGSLIRGFLAQRKRIEAMRAKAPAGAPRRTFFSSFRGGLQAITDALADAAGRERIRTGSAAVRVQRTPGGWRTELEDGTAIDADAVIVATEAWAAAQLAEGIDARIAELVGSIPCSSAATVVLAYDERDCPFDKRWHGILAPAIERRHVTGISLMSSKWPDRAPEGAVLLRGFLGGPRDEGVLEAADEDLIALAHEELADLLGVRRSATPRYARLFRWPGGMPEYTLGHLDRVDAIERLESELPGVAFAGNAYRGVGVPNALESGQRAARKVLGDLGVIGADAQREESR
ncbi:MAG: protoporphyrinogen oxidase [Anaerosomatales bacterium]|nr:protoporphyrinogen oxidase [Anaerosomatales bacterium]